MQEEYNFSQSEIDEGFEDLSIPALNSSRSLAFTDRASAHKSQQKNSAGNISSGENRNGLMERIVQNNNLLSRKHAENCGLTVGYDKWSQAQQAGTSIIDKAEKERAKKQRKLMELQAEVNCKTMAECTFKPQTNKSKIKRNLNQFLESQENYSKKIQEKRQNLKKTLGRSLKETEKFKPEINRNANNKKGQMPVYDRLYNLREKQVDEAEATNQNSFKPEITKKSQNMTRTIPVGELLYQDAMRRTHSKKEALTHASQVESRLRTGNRNSKNDKFAAQKFIKEYYYCLEALNLDEWKEELSQEMFFDILSRLGFLPHADSEIVMTQQERELLAEAYAILKEFSVDARNLCVFLLGLIGIYNINPINFQRARRPEPDQEEFNLDQLEGRQLQKYFMRLFHNRLSSEALKKTSYVDENTYQPLTNSESSEMAQRYRERMIELANQVMAQNDVELILPEDGSISHTDLLVIHKIAKEMQMQERREQLKKVRDPECTFKPKTEQSDPDTPNHHHNNLQAGIQKSHQLYSQARHKKQSAVIKSHPSQQEKASSNTQLSGFSKANQKPAIKAWQNASKNVKAGSTRNDAKNGTPYFAKDIDKTIARMYEGRKQREDQKRFLERGEKFNQKKKIMPHTIRLPEEKSIELDIPRNEVTSLISQNLGSDAQIPLREEQPLIVINVNMGDQQQQIEIRRGDEERLTEIVQQFCERHELDQESKQLLMEMVDAEVQGLLSNLDS